MAVHARHPQVEKDHRWLHRESDLQPDLAILGLGDVVAEALEAGSKAASQRRVVFDDENCVSELFHGVLHRPDPTPLQSASSCQRR